jgi:hypothetical protein
MQQYHSPNPIDRTFFAFDYAASRLGLPRTFLQLHIELTGQVDSIRLEQAIRCVQARYPVIASRLTRAEITGSPRWQMPGQSSTTDRALIVHDVTDLTSEQIQRRINHLLMHDIEPERQVPVTFHLFTGRQAGDLLIMRWPHALMDGHGGRLILQFLDECYQSRRVPEAVESADDSRHDGFTEMLAAAASRGSTLSDPRADLDAGLAPPTNARLVQIPSIPDLSSLGPLEQYVYRLDARTCQRLDANRKARGQSFRFGAYLRASALQALARVLSHRPSANDYYAVPYVLEGRQSPGNSPVCRNLFSLQRVFVPAKQLASRAAVAGLLDRATARMVTNPAQSRYLKTMAQMTRLPLAFAGTLVARTLRHGPISHHAGHLSQPPSLPMGFLVLADRQTTSFLGRPLQQMYIFRPPLPRVGIGIQVSGHQGELSIAGMCFEVRRAMLLDFMSALTDQLTASPAT